VSASRVSAPTNRHSNSTIYNIENTNSKISQPRAKRTEEHRQKPSTRPRIEVKLDVYSCSNQTTRDETECIFDLKDIESSAREKGPSIHGENYSTLKANDLAEVTSSQTLTTSSVSR
jgi:hypothetical protein